MEYFILLMIILVAPAAINRIQELVKEFEDLL